MSKEPSFSNDFEFYWKYKNYEIKTCRGALNTNIELLQSTTDSKGRPYKFTLAYYQWDNEGGNLIFVGDRPFKHIADIDINTIWKQLWLACDMLKDYYDKERSEVV